MDQKRFERIVGHRVADKNTMKKRKVMKSLDKEMDKLKMLFLLVQLAKGMASSKSLNPQKENPSP